MIKSFVSENNERFYLMNNFNLIKYVPLLTPALTPENYTLDKSLLCKRIALVALSAIAEMVVYMVYFPQFPILPIAVVVSAAFMIASDFFATKSAQKLLLTQQSDFSAKLASVQDENQKQIEKMKVVCRRLRRQINNSSNRNSIKIEPASPSTSTPPKLKIGFRPKGFTKRDGFKRALSIVRINAQPI